MKFGHSFLLVGTGGFLMAGVLGQDMPSLSDTWPCGDKMGDLMLCFSKNPFDCAGCFSAQIGIDGDSSEAVCDIFVCPVLGEGCCPDCTDEAEAMRVCLEEEEGAVGACACKEGGDEDSSAPPQPELYPDTPEEPDSPGSTDGLPNVPSDLCYAEFEPYLRCLQDECSACVGDLVGLGSAAVGTNGDGGSICDLVEPAICRLESCCGECDDEFKSGLDCLADSTQCQIDCTDHQEQPEPEEPSEPAFPDWGLPVDGLCFGAFQPFLQCLEKSRDADGCSPLCIGGVTELASTTMGMGAEMNDGTLCDFVEPAICQLGSCCDTCSQEFQEGLDCLATDSTLMGCDFTCSDVPETELPGLPDVPELCLSQVQPYTSCLAANIEKCGSCFLDISFAPLFGLPEGDDSKCAFAEEMLCPIRRCCDECDADFDALIDCVAGQADLPCPVDCDAVDPSEPADGPEDGAPPESCRALAESYEECVAADEACPPCVSGAAAAAPRAAGGTPSFVATEGRDGASCESVRAAVCPAASCCCGAELRALAECSLEAEGVECDVDCAEGGEVDEGEPTEPKDPPAVLPGACEDATTLYESCVETEECEPCSELTAIARTSLMTGEEGRAEGVSCDAISGKVCPAISCCCGPELMELTKCTLEANFAACAIDCEDESGTVPVDGESEGDGEGDGDGGGDAAGGDGSDQQKKPAQTSTSGGRTLEAVSHALALIVGIGWLVA